MSECDLVERIQKGDSDAFQELYEQHARLIFRYIRARVSNLQVAEDLTSEVFIKAWKAFPSYKWNGTPVQAWLLRIAHNLIIDRYRKNHDLFSWLPWQTAYKERQYTRVEHQDELQRAMNHLSYKEQVILHLNFFEGYNLTEVAEFLSMSAAAVRVAKHRALKRLRTILDANEAQFAETAGMLREAAGSVLEQGT